MITDLSLPLDSWNSHLRYVYKVCSFKLIKLPGQRATLQLTPTMEFFLFFIWQSPCLLHTSWDHPDRVMHLYAFLGMLSAFCLFTELNLSILFFWAFYFLTAFYWLANVADRFYFMGGRNPSAHTEVWSFQTGISAEMGLIEVETHKSCCPWCISFNLTWVRIEYHPWFWRNEWN